MFEISSHYLMYGNKVPLKLIIGSSSTSLDVRRVDKGDNEINPQDHCHPSLKLFWLQPMAPWTAGTDS